MGQKLLYSKITNNIIDRDAPPGRNNSRNYYNHRREFLRKDATMSLSPKKSSIGAVLVEAVDDSIIKSRPCKKKLNSQDRSLDFNSTNVFSKIKENSLMADANSGVDSWHQMRVSSIKERRSSG